MNTQEKEDRRLKMEDGYDIKHVTFHNLLSVVMGTVSNQTGESFDSAMLRTKSADEIYRRHNDLKAHADKLAEQLKQCLHTLPLHSSKPVVRQIISESWRTITAYESERAQ